MMFRPGKSVRLPPNGAGHWLPSSVTDRTICWSTRRTGWAAACPIWRAWRSCAGARAPRSSRGLRARVLKDLALSPRDDLGARAPAQLLQALQIGQAAAQPVRLVDQQIVRSVTLDGSQCPAPFGGSLTLLPGRNIIVLVDRPQLGP